MVSPGYDTDYLLAGLKQEDPVVFKLIYKLYWQKLYNVAFYYLKEERDAEDVVQDVFIVYSPARRSNYPFSGRYYEKLSINGVHTWAYSSGKVINTVWQGIPDNFLDRGFNGLYYIESTRLMYVFSKDEFVIHNEASLRTPGVPQKIASVFKGL